MNTGEEVYTHQGRIGRAVGSASWIVAHGDTERLAPIGTVGELLIEGHGLAKG